MRPARAAPSLRARYRRGSALPFLIVSSKSSTPSFSSGGGSIADSTPSATTDEPLTVSKSTFHTKMKFAKYLANRHFRGSLSHCDTWASGAGLGQSPRRAGWRNPMEERPGESMIMWKVECRPVLGWLERTCRRARRIEHRPPKDGSRTATPPLPGYPPTDGHHRRVVSAKAPCLVATAGGRRAPVRRRNDPARQNIRYAVPVRTALLSARDSGILLAL